MTTRILVIQGHPDPRPERFGRALAAAYAAGALTGGHEVRSIDVASLDLAILRTKEAFESEPPAAIARWQADIAWAQHLVFCYPLWLGTMPALLKAFLEQVFRPGFAFGQGRGASGWTKRLRGRSARVVVTMGMPALAYRWWFGAHGLKSFERSILGFCGIGPIRETLIGGVETLGDVGRHRWLARLHRLGRDAR